VVPDRVRFRYEELRTVFLEGGGNDDNGYKDSFLFLGMYGLFGNNGERAYVVEVCQAPSQRWSGRTDPGALLLREAFMQILGRGHRRGSCHS